MSDKRFGFDLANYEGVVQSTDFNEDWINYENLANEPAPQNNFFPEKPKTFKQFLEMETGKYGPDPDFPEADLTRELMKHLMDVFSELENPKNISSIQKLPVSGFERYGVSNFKKFIYDLYKQNRIIFNVSKQSSRTGDASDTEFFNFEILPYKQNSKSTINVNRLKDTDLAGRSHQGGKEMQNWERGFYKVDDETKPVVDPRLKSATQNYLKDKTTMEGKKVIKLTESDLIRIVKRVISEQNKK